MTITTKAQLDAARRIRASIMKPNLGGSAGGGPRINAMYALGVPSSGTLAGTNTANGVVPDVNTAGAIALPSFGGATGYLARVQYANNSSNRIMSLYDLLFKAGAYSFGADVTLTSQPSYAARLPGGDYKGLHILIEAVTTFTGTPVFTIDYLDQDGVARSDTVTGPTTMATTIVIRLPMRDGVQQITRVREAGAAGGTFNVLVGRLIDRLTFYDELTPGAGNAVISKPQDFFSTGLPIVYDTSCLIFMAESSNANRAHEVMLEIALG